MKKWKDYYELRSLVKDLIPRRSVLDKLQETSYVKEKGRKSNYHQGDVTTGSLVSLQRLLNADEIQSFVEISLRAAHCPMPFNLDVWDGLRCGFGCRYCFADSFRASLYTSFFDNYKNIGLRHCRPDYFKAELDKAMRFRGETARELNNPVWKAFALEVPLRFGIRFEDFLPIEKKKGISLDLLKYLTEVAYPIMINTKSDLVANGDYLKNLAENQGKAAVHITMITSDEGLTKSLEPGAPSFKKRLAAAKKLTDAGVRVVARIEPFMFLVNDEKDRVDEYVEQIFNAGVRHITLDTYSYSAGSLGIRRNFESLGIDFGRMFEITSNCQWLGSLLLHEFMNYLRQKSQSLVEEEGDRGFKCSTFDFGNVPSNDDKICCEVGDWFRGGFSFGNTTSAIRFIVSRGAKRTTWNDYVAFVLERGGFLSRALYLEVKRAWNLVGNPAYFPDWGSGIWCSGVDCSGQRVWSYQDNDDFRVRNLLNLIGERRD